MKPLFTIIIPCCDIEPYVKACIESITSQPVPDWECMAIVETTKDGSEAVVRKLAAGNSRIKVLTQPRSGSAAMPRNTGLMHAQGEYVFFVDGDDLLAQNALQELYDCITARPGADVYCFGCRTYTEPSSVPVKVEFPEVITNFPNNAPAEMTGVEATVLNGRTREYLFPPPWMNVFRKDYLIVNDLKFSPGFALDDGEFMPRALVLAKRVVPIHKLLYLYRIRPSSQVTECVVWRDRLNDLAMRYRNLLAFYAGISCRDDFDRRVAETWSRKWIQDIVAIWFAPYHIVHTPSTKRVESLGVMFSKGFEGFDALRRTATANRKLTSWLVKVYVQHPSMRLLIELFFRFIYFPLTRLKSRRKFGP